MGYITPDELPGTTQCRAIYIPDDRAIIAAVTGALQTLTREYNWDDEGGVSAEDTANFLQEMFDNFCFSVPPCGETPMIGEIKFWPVATPPSSDWLSLNGQAISRTTYADLFALIGVAYGTGDGSTTFNLPDARGRGLAHFGQGVGLTNRGIGLQFGAETVALTTANLASHTHTGAAHVHTQPSHTHPMPHTHQQGTRPTGTVATIAGRGTAGTVDQFAISEQPSNANTSAGGADDTGSAGTGAGGSTGSGTAHANVGPELALNAIIRAL